MQITIEEAIIYEIRLREIASELEKEGDEKNAKMYYCAAAAVCNFFAEYLEEETASKYKV